MTPEDVHAWLDRFRRIGAELMRIIPPLAGREPSGPGLRVGASGDRTFRIDARAEEVILAALSDCSCRVLSEECGERVLGGGGPQVLIDPIDGSNNARRGIPVYSTALALVEGGRVGDAVLGYVLNLVSGEEFWAVRGEGAFRNGERMAVLPTEKLELVAYEASAPSRDLPRLSPLLTAIRRSRCLGSTAIDLAALAQGALQAVVIPTPSRPFDFVAGWLLVREAGGVMTNLEGRGLEDLPTDLAHRSTLLAAASEALHREALSLIR